MLVKYKGSRGTTTSISMQIDRMPKQLYFQRSLSRSRYFRFSSKALQTGSVSPICAFVSCAFDYTYISHIICEDVICVKSHDRSVRKYVIRQTNRIFFHIFHKFVSHSLVGDKFFFCETVISLSQCIATKHIRLHVLYKCNEKIEKRRV